MTQSTKYNENSPNPTQTRHLIDNMTIKTKRDEIFQSALKYLYITAGRLAEVYGDYSPLGRYVERLDINGVTAILFAVRTARREGHFRAVAVPEKQEKWASDLFDLFNVNRNQNPFDIKQEPDTSRKYLQSKAKELFKEHGHSWRRKAYKKYNYEPVDESEVICTRLGMYGTEYLIQDDDCSRAWRPEMKKRSVEEIVPDRKPFRLMHLREQREVELTQKYNFNDAQVRIYQGIKLDKRASLFSEWRDAEPIPEFNMEGLIKRAQKYFPNFL